MRSLVLAVLATALLVMVPPLAAAFHGESVFVERDCKGHAYKPRSVVLACGDGNIYATGIKYRSYGLRVAIATATIHLNDCLPYCAAGHFHSYPGTIRLKDIVRCHDGRLYYSRALYQSSAPQGSGTAYLQPFGKCSKVKG